MSRFMTLRNAIAVLLICATPLYQAALASDILTIHSKNRVDTDKEMTTPRATRFVDAVSQKNLLGLSRKSSLSLPDVALGAAEIVELRICAIRVQFQFEDPDDPLTTGRGIFDLRSQEQYETEERHTIDMSPHNRSYFESHLRALNEYWKVVSQDRLMLTYDVFPTQQDSVYTLSKEMGYYGDTTRPIVDGLEEFFMESFKIADSDTAIHFADYDVFVVFHAGVDQQNDIGYPPTPYDLYTGFIFLGPLLIVDSDDVPVIIGEGVMMPETACQDNRVIALNGVFAHEFGHQLGLIDLYDTRSWMTQVGDFSLHDNQGRGTGADLGFERSRIVTDVLPVFPDAWSRAYLGFVDVHEISGFVRNQEVWAAELKTGEPQVLKVPISDHEYFLIENRQVDSDRDDSTNLRIDSITGVILGPAPANIHDERYLTRDYDYFLPGSGMLIWHVDETRAYMDYTGDGISNFKENTLQWYNYYPCLIPNDFGLCIDSVKWENRRFLSVVEADGIIDFGGNYRTGFGRQEDYFYWGNNHSFGPATNPSTRSNSGAYTGIWMYDISPIDTIMTVTIEFESRIEGFPQFVNNSRFPPLLADIDGDGNEEIFISGENYIVAMHQDGSPIIAPLPGREIYDSTFVLYSDTASGGMHDIVAPDGSIIKGGSYVVDMLRAIASVADGEAISTSPMVVDLNDDGVFEVSVGTDAGKVYVWSVRDEDNDGKADSLAAIDHFNDMSVVAGPVAFRENNQTYLLFSIGGGVVRWDGTDGSQLVPIREVDSVFHFAVDSDAGEAYFVGLAYGSETSYAIMSLSDLGVPLYNLGQIEVVGFTAANLDNEYGTDFVILTADGRLMILLSESSENNNRELTEIQIADSFAGGVVTAALDPTVPHYQIIFASDNLIHIYNYNGTEFSNFPQRIDIHVPAGMVRSAPIVGDVDGDGEPDIVVGTDAGEIFAFGSDGDILPQFPRFVGSNAVVSYAITENGKLFAVSEDNRIYGLPVSSQPLADEQSWRQSGLSALHQNFRGSSGVTPQTPDGGLIVDFYNYPNPASDNTTIRYRLAEEGEVTIKIFDLSGRLIYEDRDRGGAIHSHHIWDLDGYPSGVYICRLEASAGGSSEVKTHKIAVVK